MFTTRYHMDEHYFVLNDKMRIEVAGDLLEIDHGSEICTTHGTDGPGLNISAPCYKIRFKVKKNSQDDIYLQSVQGAYQSAQAELWKGTKSIHKGDFFIEKRSEDRNGITYLLQMHDWA